MLYLIPTPIGNTDDITMRALNLFKELKYFICEDTRTFKKLLGIYNIPYNNKTFFSLTSFTKQGKLNHYINILKEHEVGLVSESGTPGLSDPGKSMIKLCLEEKLSYTILPGPNALIPAIVSAGFDTSKFIFLGFLPQKKGRKTILEAITNPITPFTKGGNISIFFYESVHRIEKLLGELKILGFDGKILIAREISKMYEQIVNGNLDEVLDLITQKKLPLKGEFVVGLRNK